MAKAYIQSYDVVVGVLRKSTTSVILLVGFGVFERHENLSTRKAQA